MVVTKKCLGILVFAAILSFAGAVAARAACDVYCDGQDPKVARGNRVAASATVDGRLIQLHFSDADDTAWASIGNGSPGDEVWLDRSWNGTTRPNFTSNLGHLLIPFQDSVVPSGDHGWRTMMFAVNDPSHHQVGTVRACGKPGNRLDVACTPWASAMIDGGSPAAVAATALMQIYDPSGGNWRNSLWNNGWWISANALTAMIDYMSRSGHSRYSYVIPMTFDANKGAQGGNFTNGYIDDTGWWGLAWIRAYDYTHNPRYLAMAIRDADYMYRFWDDKCGGGVWWSADKKYKNAIPNELFLELTAALHNRLPGDIKYLKLAKDEWDWFRGSGMINSAGLVNDGLSSQCRNNGKTTWTYNQGVILGGLAELSRATGNALLLAQADVIAGAAIAHLTVNGVLTEPCGRNCGGDALAFKGPFVRNLYELARTERTSAYDGFLRDQAASLWRRACNTDGQCSCSWAGPFNGFNYATQQAALDALSVAP